MSDHRRFEKLQPLHVFPFAVSLALFGVLTLAAFPDRPKLHADEAADSGKAVAEEKNEDLLEDPPYEPMSKAELRRKLTSMQFKVTQNEDTEPKFRNQYWDNKKEGIYRCVVCGRALFSSATKFKSGTGWPSFYAPIVKGKVGYKTDYFLFYPRTEVHCGRCNAHLGHVFDDGPQDKTGKRYCMNSAAMKFEPASLAQLKKAASEDKAKE
jgi:methionine-R-sulfoxide reductase